MGSESNSLSTSMSVSTSSPSAKRNREPEDDVYIDNLHSHKRYLSEMKRFSSADNGVQLKRINCWRPAPRKSHGLSGQMTSKQAERNNCLAELRLNKWFQGGAQVSFCVQTQPRDEMYMQYSPMSEDSDDSRYCEVPVNNCSSQSDSLPTSPVSPHRYQRPPTGPAPSTSSYPLHGSLVTGASCSQPRQRGSDSEGRFPSSPSDICHSGNLRRAALLRSVQMRTHPPFGSSFDLSFGSAQEPVPNIEVEERSCSYMKSLADEREIQIEDCSSMRISEPGFNQEKSCRVLNINIKGNESRD